MGTITILHSLTDPEAREVVAWEGPYIDFLEHRFPGGFSQPHRTVDMSNGGEVWGESALEPVGERNLTLAFAPGGIDPFTAAIIVVASVAISLAVTFLLTPKAPTAADGSGAGGVYSVNSQANQARLGAPVPEQFGQWERTPEYASQSYRVYAGNEEIRYFLLCLGAGKHQVDGVRIGDTPVADLPSGIIEYETYQPADHGSALGTIDADFGIHENVATSGEVDQQELKSLERITDSLVGSVVLVGDNTISFEGEIANAGISPGDLLIVSTPASIAGTYSIASSTTTSITITTTFPTSVFDEVISFQVNATGAQEAGPFVVNRSGTTTQKIEIDIEFPAGLYIQKDNGSFQNLTLNFTAKVQEIDDAGNNVGSHTNHVFSITEATSTPQRRTWQVTKPSGRYKVSLRRSDSQELKARDAQRSVWTGLKAYLDYDNSDTRYGDVTLMAMKVTGAQAISGSSQSRIFVKSTRVINQLGTTTPVAGGNLADVMSHIYVDQVGRPSGELDSAAFSAFRSAQASRSGFNGVFDSVGTVWSALETVAALGRAKPFPKAMTLSLVTDGVKTRSSLVAPHNTLEGGVRVQYNWIDPGGYDGVVIEYFDPATFERKTASWPSDEDDLINPKQQKALGLTNDAEALSMAKYIWRQITQRNVEFSWRMELDGRNFKPYDRVAVVVPEFNWAEAAFVRFVSGNEVTLSEPAPAGALSVILRKSDGSVSDVLGATGNGTNTITLDSAPPFALQYDGTQVPTVCAFALTSEFTVQDVTIMKVTPAKTSTALEAVNYDATLFDGLV